MCYSAESDSQIFGLTFYCSI